MASRNRVLALLALAELLGMSVWFSASALAPQLARAWALTPAQAGWLTATVQLGFVAGTAAAALLNLADIVPLRVYFALAALGASASNLALLAAGGFAPALVSRFATGFFLAGVYPPAMKMIATWYRDARGFAIGTIVGALTVGKAMPYLVHGLERAGAAPVVGGASAAAALAGVLVLAAYRDGPFPFARRPFAWSLVGTVLRHRPTRLAIGGYLGHMWELYAMWTWIAAFLAAGAGLRARAADVAGFAAIAVGGAGCVAGGWAADRWGRERVTIWAMATSGSCAVLIGLGAGAPAVALAVALAWGFSVVADSAQFSALVTELAPSHAVGTALTLQTSLGFLLTLFSIQLVPHLVAAAGWRWAFVALAAGPACGIAAMRRLGRLRSAVG
ncbi:MAG TPA: MFS transporter [Gemmatimonadales bacterium]|nr:MFS transporter [Gemmatimonadales bacterium]